MEITSPEKELPVFPSYTLKIVCVSDTHAENPTTHIAAGDVFIHAGDMTNLGSVSGLKSSYEWIASLPHKLKIVVAGNHDYGLDSKHKDFSQEIVDLFTSTAAREAGIQYLNHETRTVGYYTSANGSRLPIRVYGNPSQPIFTTGKPYAFIYKPHPSPESAAAWKDAPSHSEGAHIWVMHSPPLGHLDDINDVYKTLGLTGCKIQADTIAASKPLLAVFGHYHFSWGIERVRWAADEAEKIEKVQLLTASKERRAERGWTGPVERSEWDFSDELEVGRETVFVNAAWQVMDKSSKERNMPFVLTVRMPADKPQSVL